MPYRFKVNSDEYISDIFSRLSSDLINCYKNQKYPFEYLQKDLCLNEKGILGLYDVCINYYNTVIPKQIDGFDISNTEFYNGQQSYSMQIIIRHWESEQLELDFDFKVSDYSMEQIQDMFEKLMILAEQIVDDKIEKVKDCSLLNDNLLQYVLYGFNDTGMDYPKEKTFIDLLNNITTLFPEKTSVSKDKESLTYGVLNELSDKAAGYLEQAGIKKDDIVAVIPNHDISSIITIIAVMKCGGIYLPIDKNNPPKRILDILESSKSGYLISDNSIESFAGKHIDFKSILSYEIKIKNKPELLPTDIAYIIYTSGSTGKPKGVMCTNKNLINYLFWAKAQYIKTLDEVFPLYSNLAFDFSITSLFLPCLLYTSRCV